MDHSEMGQSEAQEPKKRALNSQGAPVISSEEANSSETFSAENNRDIKNSPASTAGSSYSSPFREVDQGLLNSKDDSGNSKLERDLKGAEMPEESPQTVVDIMENRGSSSANSEKAPEAGEFTCKMDEMKQADGAQKNLKKREDNSRGAQAKILTENSPDVQSTAVPVGSETPSESDINSAPEKSSSAQQETVLAAPITPSEAKSTLDRTGDQSPLPYIWPAAEIAVDPNAKKAMTPPTSSARLSDDDDTGGYLVKPNDVSDSEGEGSSELLAAVPKAQQLRRNELPMYMPDDDDPSDSSIELDRAMADESEKKTPLQSLMRSPSTDTIQEEDSQALNSSAPEVSFRGELSYRQDGVFVRNSKTSSAAAAAAAAAAATDDNLMTGPSQGLIPAKRPSKTDSIVSAPGTRAETLRRSRRNLLASAADDDDRRNSLKQTNSMKQLWKGLKNTMGAITRMKRSDSKSPSRSKSPTRGISSPRFNNNDKNANNVLLAGTFHGEGDAARGRALQRKVPSRTRSKSEQGLRSKDDSEHVTPEELLELERVALALKQGLQYTSRRDMSKRVTWNKCFSGSAAVDLLCKLLGTGRKQAKRVGREIAVHFNLFVSCPSTEGGTSSGDLTAFLMQRQQPLLKDSGNCYYRLMAYLPCEVSAMNMELKMAAFEAGVSVKDRRQGLRKYKKCFVGRDAVSFLVASRLVASRQEAVDLCRKFVNEYNLFETVLRDHSFEDSYKFYRFVDRKNRYFSINDVLSLRLIQMQGESMDLSGNHQLPKTEDEGSTVAKSEKSSNDASMEFSDAQLDDGSEEEGIIFTKDYMHLCEVADVFERGMKISDNTKNAGSKKKVDYEDTFVASRAVTFLVTSGLAHSREEAATLGKRLEREFNLIQEVTGKHDFGDTNHYFRFTDKKNRFTKPLKVEKSLDEIAELFEKGVKVKDYTYRLSTHRNTFVGSKAVNFLVNSRLATSRAEAVRIGRLLIEKYNLFERVTGDREFCDDREFFRFTPSKDRINFETDMKSQDLRVSQGRRPGYLLSKTTASRTDLATKDIPEELLQLAESFLTGVKVKDNKFRAKKYRQTFVGSDAVSFMVNSSLAMSRKEAVELGKRLSKEVNLFSQVDGIRDFRDDYLLYRFEERFENTLLSEQGSPARGLVKGLSGLNTMNAKALPLEKIAEVFRSNVHVSVHRNRVNKYKDTFVGSEAVDFLVGSGLSESRVEAVDLGRSMVREFYLFQHIHKDHEFEDEDFLYQFCYEGEIRAREEIEIDKSRLVEIAKDLEHHIKVKEHRIRLRVYENTFLGREAVDHMMEHHVASTRREAVLIGRAIAKEFNLFEHVTNDKKFEDEEIPYFLQEKEDRYKGLDFGKHRARRNIFASSDDDLSSSNGDNGCESSEEFGTRESIKYEFQSEDTEWAQKMAKFEKRMKKSTAYRDSDSDDDSVEAAKKHRTNSFLKWASKFVRLDPRYQIQYFFDYVAQEGAQHVEENDFDLDSLRPIFNFLPNRSQVFTVWRPTSLDAIRKMMLGEAVGKGLDIKGKSAKRGKLSGFVPFLQIGENKHKSKIRPPSKDGVVRVFYPGHARRARDIAAERLERIGQEMITTVKHAKHALASHKTTEEARKDALEAMLLDMTDPTIRYLDGYAPQRWGFEIPERLFWEAYFVRQDCTRKPGSEYDTGRPSQPAFQDMNFAALRSEPKGDAPRACVYQGADIDSPMNPFELLVAYEEKGRVMPVVSDFDCFLVGTKRVKFNSPLEPKQTKVLNWYVNEIANVMDESVHGDAWTVQWLEVLKRAARDGFYPEMPRFGFGDPKSYSIMKNAVSRLSHSGAVRHGAECFNYYFPQDLDDEFLVIANDLPDNQPWCYVDVEGLQDILSKKIDQGFTFPLNPKWVLADSFRWKELYDKLLMSDKEETQQSMNIWFPPESGLRELIEDIHRKRPEGFYKAPSKPRLSSLLQEGIKARHQPKKSQSDHLSTVFALHMLETYQKRTKEEQGDKQDGSDEEGEPKENKLTAKFAMTLLEKFQRRQKKINQQSNRTESDADTGDENENDHNSSTKNKKAVRRSIAEKKAETETAGQKLRGPEKAKNGSEKETAGQKLRGPEKAKKDKTESETADEKLRGTEKEKNGTEKTSTEKTSTEKASTERKIIET